MNTEEMNKLQATIEHHRREVAILSQQLPEQEQTFYLLNALTAWNVAAIAAEKPLTAELFIEMVQKGIHGYHSSLSK